MRLKKNLIFIFLMLFFASPLIDYSFCEDCKSLENSTVLICNICQNTIIITEMNNGKSIIFTLFCEIILSEPIFLTEPIFSIEKPPQNSLS